MKQPNPSGASCLSRCLIYKVHAASSRRNFILAHRFRFVKSFFQVFSNFFVLFHSPRSRGFFAPASQPTRLDYHTRFSLSSTFFKLFQTFFKRPLQSSLCGPLRPAGFPCRKALAYISKTPHLCQHLFSLFFAFFSTSFSTTIFAASLPF